MDVFDLIIDFTGKFKENSCYDRIYIACKIKRCFEAVLRFKSDLRI